MTPTAQDVAPDGIEVWVCPNCASTYHTSMGGDLRVVPNIRTSMQNSADEDPSEWGKVSGYRADCQVCKNSREAQEHGGPFQRERVVYVKASAVEGVS